MVRSIRWLNSTVDIVTRTVDKYIMFITADYKSGHQLITGEMQWYYNPVLGIVLQVNFKNG